jgi:hypothetical protein
MRIERNPEGLAVDVDTRISELWLMAWEPATVVATLMEDADFAAAIGALMRAAYGKGYCDALREDAEGRRGELGRAHGYTLI